MTDTTPLGTDQPAAVESVDSNQGETPYQLSVKRGFLAFAILLGCQMIAGFVFAVAFSVSAVMDGQEADVDLPAITAAAIIVSGIVVLWWARSDLRRFGSSFAEQIGLRPSRMSAFETGILIVGCFVVVRLLTAGYATYVLPLINATDAMGGAEQMLGQAKQAGSMFGQYGMLAAAILIAPVVEELVFRGYLQSALAKRMSAWGAISIASAVFASMHGSLTLWPIYFMLGWAMGWVYEKTGSLKAAIVFHFINNLIFSLVAINGWGAS